MSLMSRMKDAFRPTNKGLTDLELSDLGLSRLDCAQLESSKPGTRKRMETLAARFGVTPRMIDADRGLALELALTCGHCVNAKACQNAIDLGVDFRTDRCPNASVYADMSPT